MIVPSTKAVISKPEHIQFVKIGCFGSVRVERMVAGLLDGQVILL